MSSSLLQFTWLPINILDCSRINDYGWSVIDLDNNLKLEVLEITADNKYYISYIWLIYDIEHDELVAKSEWMDDIVHTFKYLNDAYDKLVNGT